MKKMTFLVGHNSYEAFLERLRQAGVLHVRELGNAATNSAEADSLMAELHQYDQILRTLDDVRLHGDEYPIAGSAAEVLDRYKRVTADVARTTQELQQTDKDIATYAPWGNFDPSTVEKIAAAGYRICLFSVPSQNWNADWEHDFNAFVVSSDNMKVYFVTITKGTTAPDIEADQQRLPTCQLNTLEQRKHDANQRLAQLDLELRSIAKNGVDAIKEGRAEALGRLEYCQVKMNTDTQAAGFVKVLSGWLPADKSDDAVRQLDSNGVYISVDDPRPTDTDIPILLNNNWFVKLFEPFTRLYMLPDYHELDLTVYIAPFFMLFFGLCFGDIGYGLLMLLALPVFRKLFHLIDANFTDGIIILLGLSTMVCGALTGSFFGFNIYNIDLSFVQGLKSLLYQDQMNLLYMSFAVGGIHIVVSMILKSINRIIQFGARYAFSTIGWIVLIIGSLIVYFVPALGFGSLFYKIVLALWFIGVFLFSSPDKQPITIKNLLLNIGGGLWDTYNMVTGMLGDVLSYVRLFALGMSGSVLAQVFDDLALGVFNTDSVLAGVATFFGLAAIFLFGHAINIFMNFLSSMIHPMRLIFVEFFKNTGYMGGGVEYHPFK